MRKSKKTDKNFLTNKPPEKGDVPNEKEICIIC